MKLMQLLRGSRRERTEFVLFLVRIFQRKGFEQYLGQQRESNTKLEEWGLDKTPEARSLKQ